MFQHHDIAPTLLEAAGLRTPAAMEGSIWPVARGDLEAAAGTAVQRECTRQAKWSLRTRTSRLILSRGSTGMATRPRRLYDLRSDSGEG
jgi:arylsulfatase A-like enzyme